MNVSLNEMNESRRISNDTITPKHTKKHHNLNTITDKIAQVLSPFFHSSSPSPSPLPPSPLRPMITQAPAESEPIVALATSNHNMPAGRSGRRHELGSRAVCRLTSACGERARGRREEGRAGRGGGRVMGREGRG